MTDDVASAPADRRGERRGIAGDVFVFKIAGAAADLGHDFADVERLARHANANTASMGVALGPCSLPQTAVPNFQIGDDEMEVGMGIHGEPGIERTRLETADKVVDRLLGAILSDLRVTSGDRVAVMVNGLGSTSMMELYIVHRRVRTVLADHGIAIHRSFVGEYATSLEMAGASVTLMRLDDELASLLDHPCRTLALTIGDAAASPTPTARAARTAQVARPVTVDAPAAPLIEDGALTPAVFRAMIDAAAERIGDEKDRLSELDGVIGDGDHGVTMDTGWRAIRTAVAAAPPDATVSALCRTMSHAFLEAVGASAGPLYATAFLRAAEAVRDRRNLDAGATVALLTAMSDGIRARGGASPGDKTMVDAWVPAVEAAQGASETGGDVAACLEAAALAAQTGMNATAEMTARLGRAAKLGARSSGHIDPGAASAAIILAAWAATATRCLS